MSGPIHFTPGNQQPRVSKEEWIELQQQCSLLTDVCSEMARRWRLAGEPLNKTYPNWPQTGTPDPYGGSFSWTAENLCQSDILSNNPLKFEDYIFPNGSAETMIWSSYRYGPGFNNIHVEPATFITKVRGKPHVAYVAFRGTQTKANGGLDLQYDQSPNPMDVLGGTVMKGFEKYFAGCGIKADGTRPADSASVTVPGKTLYQSLKDISYKHGGTVKDLIVTGHSMGSTTAQLTGALACKEGWFERVIVSCSASPRFGTAGFKTWYDQLRSEKPHHMLNDYTWRFTNRNDFVPKVPGAPYTEMGTEVWFEEKNGNEHNPCCTYSYAINNPDQTHNPNIDTCVFPTPEIPPEPLS